MWRGQPGCVIFFQPVFLLLSKAMLVPELSSHWHQLRPGSPLDHSVESRKPAIR
jgi:hypothetical protein